MHWKMFMLNVVSVLLVTPGLIVTKLAALRAMTLTRLEDSMLVSHLDSFTSQTDVHCCWRCLQRNTCVAVSYQATTGHCLLHDKIPADNAGDLAQAFGMSVYHSVVWPCEEMWILYEGWCYKYISDELTREQANDTCAALDAQLVDIHSEEEHTFIVDNVISDNKIVWCGLNDIVVEGDFVWPSGEKITYNNFDVGEPENSTSKNCVVFRKQNRKWSDARCDMENSCICEKKHLIY